MGRNLLKGEGAVLGETSIKSRYDAVVQRGMNMSRAFDVTSSVDFAISAWHLIADWLPKADKLQYQLAMQKVDVQNLPQEMKVLRAALRDVAIGEKHYIFDRPNEDAKRNVETIETGEVSDYFSYFFHESIPGVTTKDGYYFSVRKLRDLVLEYLEWVFDENVPSRHFPGALLGNIWVCRIANRDKSAVPPVGAIIPVGGDSGFVT